MTNQRKPMSDEAKAKIAESVRKSFEAKRLAAGVSMSQPEVLTVLPECVKMEDLTFDPKLFEPIKTGKAIDTLLSTDGGFPRATNFMMVGDPGVGYPIGSSNLWGFSSFHLCRNGSYRFIWLREALP